MSSVPPLPPSNAAPPASAEVAHLRFFRSMDRVNRAIQGTSDLEQMMCDVLDAVLAIFECDRAWLLYPCDPDAPTWRVQMERTRPEYPGALAAGLDVPMDPEVAHLYRTILAAPGPHAFGPETKTPIPDLPATVFHVRSMLGMALYPKEERPYMFGLHQCSRARVWTLEEIRIFQEIGRRLADALTSVLAVRRLRDSEARYRGFLDNATVGFFLLDERGVIQDVNRQACESLGLSREELVGSTPVAFDPDLTPEVLETMMKVVATGKPFHLDTRHRRKDGTTFPVEVRARKMVSGARWWSVTLVRDLTERKRAEEALRSSEERLRAFFDTSNAGMMEADEDLRITRANEAFCRMLGAAPGELSGTPLLDLLFPEDQESFFMKWGVLRSRGKDSAQAEQRYRRKDGTALWTLAHVVVLSRDDSGAPARTSAVVIDLTERKRLEEHLHRAKKMEAIGQLAGGVAHDFNNLLTIINGYSEMLLVGLSGAEGLEEAVTAIRDAGERAARLTAQLLAFSRKAVVALRLLDLNGVIGEASRMLSRVLGEDVTLVTELSPDISAVRADAGQIEQVVMNVAVNARDAMPKGGRLTLSTDEVEIGPGESWDAEEIRPGRHVRLRISDTGSGMSEETRARLFEPFFTTKAIGRGTGLGLAAVYGIVRQASGHVSVESRLGEGTVFTFLFPAAPPRVPRD